MAFCFALPWLPSSMACSASVSCIATSVSPIQVVVETLLELRQLDVVHRTATGEVERFDSDSSRVIARLEPETIATLVSEIDSLGQRRSMTRNNAMRNTRWGTPEELANLIVFALSDRASFVNGAVLVADNAMDKS